MRRIILVLVLAMGEEPGVGSDQVSRIFSSTPPTCTETVTGLTPITDGNYVVHDGTF